MSSDGTFLKDLSKIPRNLKDIIIVDVNMALFIFMILLKFNRISKAASSFMSKMEFKYLTSLLTSQILNLPN